MKNKEQKKYTYNDYNYTAIIFINGNNQIIRREQREKKGHDFSRDALIIGMNKKDALSGSHRAAHSSFQTSQPIPEYYKKKMNILHQIISNFIFTKD